MAACGWAGKQVWTKATYALSAVCEAGYLFDHVPASCSAPSLITRCQPQVQVGAGVRRGRWYRSWWSQRMCVLSGDHAFPAAPGYTRPGGRGQRNGKIDVPHPFKRKRTMYTFLASSISSQPVYLVSAACAPAKYRPAACQHRPATRTATATHHGH